MLLIQKKNFMKNISQLRIFNEIFKYLTKNECIDIFLNGEIFLWIQSKKSVIFAEKKME